MSWTKDVWSSVSRLLCMGESRGGLGLTQKLAAERLGRISALVRQRRVNVKSSLSESWRCGFRSTLT